MKRLFHIVIFLLIIGGGKAEAQDIHFSQFLAAPFNYNPAVAGQFNGDWRLIGNQRTQWRSVTQPYQTVGGSIDARNPGQLKGLGASLSMYQDRAGDSYLNTFQINLGASFLSAISADSSHTISVGGQLGITTQSINYDELKFDNQWNGVAYDPGQLIGESFPTQRLSVANLNIGTAYYWRIDDGRSFTAGLSLFNLLPAQVSFLENSGIKRDVRLNVHAQADVEINEQWIASPSLLLQFQGTYKEAILGGTGTYVMIKESGIYRTVFGGLYYRTRDAGYILAGMDYDNWRVGVSYDINLSDLRPASLARGGLEISVIYIWRKFRPPAIKYRVCPDYI
jgi:type IX secretion system PorP/SprF family membrane protein